MAVETRIEDGIKWYRCCSCNVWWKVEPSSIGAVGNAGVYCPSCADELDAIEMDLWHDFMKEFGILPNRCQAACLKRLVWIWLALPLQKAEVMYHG
ncbi:MAG: hypothetical protein PVG39_24150 [Desulfobacteraceae bacterium]|jgi:hypothetical protein